MDEKRPDAQFLFSEYPARLLMLFTLFWSVCYNAVGLSSSIVRSDARGVMKKELHDTLPRTSMHRTLTSVKC